MVQAANPTQSSDLALGLVLYSDGYRLHDSRSVSLSAVYIGSAVFPSDGGARWTCSDLLVVDLPGIGRALVSRENDGCLGTTSHRARLDS